MTKLIAFLPVKLWSSNSGFQRGSLTVESALIIPMLLFMLMWIINVVFVLYQYAAHQSYADLAVGAAQRSWGNRTSEIESGRLQMTQDLNEEWVYWNIWDREAIIKQKSLEGWLAEKVGNDPFLQLLCGDAEEPTINVAISEALIGGNSISVEITDHRWTLFSSLRTKFGFLPRDRIVVKSCGTLYDPAELIRTLDWGRELYFEDIAQNPDGALAKLSERILEVKDQCMKLPD